ncbi:hypothetical protein [Acaryochloris sp. CCMEE 5410]|uniref:hypothetical protein n=1 Tax=Acaryochloris sp. CCMEE 5410 TaxID=310037 RepID=UPI001F3B5FEB|nr:hypothetical protein [Acaryochloris sp. CCMEE 5410]
MMHPIPRALRPLSMHFLRQYQEANIVLPEFDPRSTPEEHLLYKQKMDVWIGLENRIFIASLAENQFYWSLASALIGCGLWFSVNWLGSKWEAR